MDGDNKNNGDGSWQFQPGDTISPRQAETASPQQPLAQQPVPQSAPAQPVAPQPAVVQPEPEVLQPQSVATPPRGADGSISWTASEFVAHSKSMGWYLMLAGATVILAAIVFLCTHDKISTSVVLVAALAFGGYANRKPRELAYRLDETGLQIDSRRFTYGQFRSFAVMREGAFSSIAFVPMKRFAPLTAIYYDPRDEDKIVDMLSSQLPLEERQHDLVDRLMWRIRF